MKIKTEDLTGMALDWAVAKAEGLSIIHDGIAYVINEARNPRWLGSRFTNCATYSPSTKWGDGGPIIEREGGSLWSTVASGWRHKAKYDYANDREGVTACGPTPLIAAMRCYVVSNLGHEIDVPDDLLET